jgi:hypothetical protein
MIHMPAEIIQFGGLHHVSARLSPGRFALYAAKRHLKEGNRQSLAPSIRGGAALGILLE